MDRLSGEVDGGTDAVHGDGKNSPLLASLQAQAEVIAALEARVRDLEMSRPAPPVGRQQAPDTSARVADTPRAPNRRELLTRTASAAAGAVVASTALVISEATPASAAPGVFTGDPAVSGTASPSSGTGVSGISTSGYGVTGSSSSSTGVSGTSTSGYGVRGTSNTNIGLFGLSASSTGVYAVSNTGPGVKGVSESGVALVAEAHSKAHLHLLYYSALVPPLTSSGSHSTGEIVFDNANDLWLCTAGGSPGEWRRVSGANTAGALTILSTPKRVYDSRPAFPPAIGVKVPLAPATPRTCDLKANASGVPAGATAVLVSLVATGTSAAGFLTVYKSGIAWPGTSNLNWSGPGQNVAVTTLTAVNASAICNLYANVATDVVVDVIGYYQ